MSMSTQKEKSASKQDCKGQNNKTHSFLHTHVHSCLTAFNLNIRKEWQSYLKRVTEKEDVFLMPCDCLQISSFPFHTEIGLRGWRPPVNKLSCPRLSDCLCSASLTLTLLDLTIKKQHWATSAFGWEAAKAHIHAADFSKIDNDPVQHFFPLLQAALHRGRFWGATYSSYSMRCKTKVLIAMAIKNPTALFTNMEAITADWKWPNL